MSRMVNMGIFNNLSNFELKARCGDKNSWYRLHLCCIGTSFNQIVLSLVDNIINVLIESVYLICNESF